MTVSERDRKILLVIAPVLCLVAFWFLLLAPKRQEAATAGQELAEQQQKRDDLQAQASRLATAKTTFARDYRDVVRLGKAIPSKVDLPSLIVQLDTAAKGTGIKFTKIKTGERDPAAAVAATQAPPAGSAQTAPGQAVESANDAKTTSDSASSGSENADPSATDASTSTSETPGGLPVGGGAPATGGAAGSPPGAVSGLDTVPLEFQFDGSFFDLADFFHRLKRFVKVSNKDLKVRGRLMSIDSMKFDSQASTFPTLGVEVKATVYLSPEKEGDTAGATPAGPSTTTASAPGADAPSTPATPTAVSTP